MKTTLVIARHGNTFNPGEEPRRVGAKTDMSLTESGRLQARTLGAELANKNLIPSIIYSSFLKRTIETASLAFEKMKPYPLSSLNEIDYGPDENKQEQDVIRRIGNAALKSWEDSGLMPEGWSPRPEQIIANWQKLAGLILKEHTGQTVLVVTSNGTARFAPHLTADFESFRKKFSLKLATGAYGILEHDGKAWQAVAWNVKPPP